MTEINPKKGAIFVICAELDTASGLREPLDVVGERGHECQGSEAAFGWEGIARVLQAVVLASGLDLMFKEQPMAPGEPRCGAIWPPSWGCTRVFLELYIATCANLLELVN